MTQNEETYKKLENDSFQNRKKENQENISLVHHLLH